MPAFQCVRSQKRWRLLLLAAAACFLLAVLLSMLCSRRAREQEKKIFVCSAAAVCDLIFFRFFLSLSSILYWCMGNENKEERPCRPCERGMLKERKKKGGGTPPPPKWQTTPDTAVGDLTGEKKYRFAI